MIKLWILSNLHLEAVAFPDLKHRRLYSFGKPSAYPALEPMIAGRINVALNQGPFGNIFG
jgi:hypothetical protein